MREKSRILVLILVLLLLISLLICVFEVLPLYRLIEEGGKGEEGGNGEGGESDGGGEGKNGGKSEKGGEEGGGKSEGKESGTEWIKIRVGKCELCFNNLTSVPLFEIYGAVKSPYLRVLAGEIYEDGVWSILNYSILSKYSGESIKQLVTNYADASLVEFQIIPLSIIKGFIPSANNPLKLRLLEDKNDLWYYPDQQIFFSEEIDGDYYVTYINYLLDEGILTSASTPSDARYLNISSYLLSALKPLALEITEAYGAEAPYEKLKAIKDFLKNNYKYDKNYTHPPNGFDPVLWFLFHEKRGVCVHFNSAFVLLARSLGIPSRLVGGYLIDPEQNYQVVCKCQAHAYAEVLFEGLGWVIFDATPPGCCKIDGGRPIQTITEIINLDNTGVKGSAFRVLGRVLDEYGSKVSGLVVKVYLKHNKSENEIGTPVGVELIEDGLFNVTCIAPLDIDVGDYFVIAHTLTNNKYLGSWSDPQIKIMARTYLSVESPEKVITCRTFTLSGALKEEINDSPIENETIMLTVGSKVYLTDTDKEGTFLVNCSIEEPGNYTLILRFDGSEYYLNSTCEKALRALDLEITPMTKNHFIRGEDAYIFGRVHAEDLSGDYEEVLISLDEINIARVRTDSNGYFNTTFHVPSNYTLGKSILKYFLLCNGRFTAQEIKIMARTRITASAPESPIESDKTFNITAMLLDDLQQPIQGAMIFLNYSCQNRQFSVNSTTNENGVVLFNINLSVSKKENVSYLLIFTGNEAYLGAQLLGHIKVVPILGSFIYEIYFLPMMIALGGSFFAFFLLYRRRGWLRKKINGINGSLNEADKIQEEKTPVSSAVTRRNANLTITFPDIKKPFPLVWGINERLAVHLEIKEDNNTPVAEAVLRLIVNGEDYAYLKSSQNGDAETYLTLMEKRDHKFIAHFSGNDQLNEAVAETSIRIVDYREEIVNLFNSFFEAASKKYQGLNRFMTAREMQLKLTSQIPESKYKYLEDLVSIFEVANYSLHPITRREYERMFLAKLDLEHGEENDSNKQKGHQ